MPKVEPSTLSAQDQIEYLATKVMGWTVKEQEHIYHNRCYPKLPKQYVKLYLDGSGHCVQQDDTWFPLTDWNHWRQVEEKVMETKLLWSQFLCAIRETDPKLNLCGEYMKTDLPTRVSCLISAHQELYGNKT